MVAIPVTNDQSGVAARIAYTKTGAVIPLKEMTVPRLASLIDEVLSNPEYRDNANQIKKAIAKTDGLEKAADLLEEVFQLSKQTVAQVKLIGPVDCQPDVSTDSNRRGHHQCLRQALIMKIGFLTHSVPGHLHPFTALARRVQARGHNVAMIGFFRRRAFGSSREASIYLFLRTGTPSGSDTRNRGSIE
jgi:UDP:flavonoid glycosyltransferase YjiC (YdhE family)